MSDMTYGDLNGPGIWLTADVRRRQISQLLHVITPAAAMCIVLTATPEVIFGSAASWSSWPWNLLLAIGLGVLLWDVRALLLRRRGRRTPLTVPVDSMVEAIRFAEDALGRGAWPPGTGSYLGSRTPAVTDGDSTALWQSYAVPPLAALAYAASRSEVENPAEWLESTATRLTSSESDEGWCEAARAVGATAAPAVVQSSFFRTMNMEPRQRDSVALVMREAVLGASAAVRR